MSAPQHWTPGTGWPRRATRPGWTTSSTTDCVFRSPAVHTPQEGKALTTAYLSAALVVLGPTLTYRHEWWDDDSAVLEFTAELDGLTLHGIDMLRWGADDRLTEFTVMVRPFKGLTTLMERMLAELTAS